MRKALLVLALVLCSVFPTWADGPPAQRLLDTMLQEQGLTFSRRDVQIRWVRRIGARLAEKAPHNVSWKFFVVEDRLPQAYTPAQGLVVVSEGLLDLHLTEDEMAGILAHEMAHGANGDVIVQRVPDGDLLQLETESMQIMTERVQASRDYESACLLGAQSTRQLCEERLARLAQRARLVEDQQLLLLSCSEVDRLSNHACEMRADRMGRQHAAMAGYSPLGLESALCKILVSCEPSLTEESMTHPALARRIDALHSQQ